MECDFRGTAAPAQRMQECQCGATRKGPLLTLGRQDISPRRRSCVIQITDLSSGQRSMIMTVATYEDIAKRVKKDSGFVPKTCWIAHVLELNGLPVRRASNRIDPHVRKEPCPPEKRKCIEDAMRALGVI